MPRRPRYRAGLTCLLRIGFSALDGRRKPSAGRLRDVEISRETARRFVLGRQGLWPGRRWRGSRGTVKAMHAIEHLQLDPLVIVARAQDLALQSRVIDYH